MFGRRDEDERVQVGTPVGTIGIRGTGFYTESAPDRTYFCTCYGHTRIEVAGGGEDPKTSCRSTTSAPRYILAQPDRGSGKRASSARRSRITPISN